MRQRSDCTNAGQSALLPIVRKFLDQHPHKLEAACFGVAGPVKDGRASLTNLKWTLDAKKLASALKVRRVGLINDLVAHAEGINALTAKDVVTLHRGKSAPCANRAIIAPGTGLGEAGLVYDPHSKDYRAFASEGGHCDFSPKDDREDALLKFMWKEIGRCSWEDVLSGPGLKHIFAFLIAQGPYQVEGARLDSNAKPTEISSAAVKGECPAAVAAVKMMARFYGSEAGNLALKTLATDGVYIGGGIAGYIIKFLREPEVRNAFTKKGMPNIQKLLSAIPIHVITSKDGALLGSAHYAQRI